MPCVFCWKLDVLVPKFIPRIFHVETLDILLDSSRINKDTGCETDHIFQTDMHQ